MQTEPRRPQAERRPLRRRTPTTIPGWTAAVAAGCVALHLMQLAGEPPAPSQASDLQLTLVAFGAKNTALISDARESWRLLTTHLVHTGWLHLVFNLAFFLPVAGALETGLRRHDFVALLAVGGVVSGLSSVLWTPEVSAGLSGVVFAVLGAAVAVGFRHGASLPPSLRSHFGWPVVPFVSLLLLIGHGSAQIDHASHYGGLAAGCAFGPWTRPRPRPRTVVPDDPRAAWRVLTPTMAVLGCVLLAAPAIARRGAGPTRYRYENVAVLEAPGGWTAEFGPFGDIRFSGATDLVSASVRQIPSRGRADPARWYVREHLGALADSGEIANVTEHRDVRGRSSRRFTYRRAGRPCTADVTFVAMPQASLVVTFESPTSWRDKYGETRTALLGSIGPTTTTALASTASHAAAPGLAFTAVSSSLPHP
ncbi:MAG: rhomboid family intramembrane serine protease [Myxococcales bacterium FL481]|nr:MAG: rhomboid family intramembrane serine protease [Myxococcales bacterium FL481]